MSVRYIGNEIRAERHPFNPSHVEHVRRIRAEGSHDSDKKEEGFGPLTLRAYRERRDDLSYVLDCAQTDYAVLFELLQSKQNTQFEKRCHEEGFDFFYRYFVERSLSELDEIAAGTKESPIPDDFRAFLKQMTEWHVSLVASRKESLSSEERASIEKEAMARQLAIFFREDCKYHPSRQESHLGLETFVGALEAHQAHVKMLQESKKERLDQFLSLIKTQILQAIERGSLPITKKAFIHRWERLSIRFGDPIMGLARRVPFQYLPSEHVIEVFKYDLSHRDFALLAYEAVSAIAGQTNEVSWYIDDMIASYDAGKLATAKNVRVGLWHNPLKQEEGVDKRRHFFWLHAAITAQIGLEIFPVEANVYHQERALLARLLRYGLPKDIVLRAYFAEYNSHDVDGGMRPVKRLFQQVKKIFGSAFLANIDAFLSLSNDLSSGNVNEIGRENIDQLIQWWDTAGQAFPDQLEYFLHGASPEMVS